MARIVAWVKKTRLCKIGYLSLSSFLLWLYRFSSQTLKELVLKRRWLPLPPNHYPQYLSDIYRYTATIQRLYTPFLSGKCGENQVRRKSNRRNTTSQDVHTDRPCIEPATGNTESQPRPPPKKKETKKRVQQMSCFSCQAHL